MWLTERKGSPLEPLFPTITGQRLSRDAIEHRLAHYVAKASQSCPSIGHKQVTAHTLRHTAAMRLLLAGVDTTVIALWLGHEQVSTTTIYFHADMNRKSVRSLASDRQPPNPVAIALAMPSWPSWRPCDYADTFSVA